MISCAPTGNKLLLRDHSDRGEGGLENLYIKYHYITVDSLLRTATEQVLHVDKHSLPEEVTRLQVRKTV